MYLLNDPRKRSPIMTRYSDASSTRHHACTCQQTSHQSEVVRPWPDFPYGGEDPDFRSVDAPRQPSRLRTLGADLVQSFRKAATGQG
jgi:hypothetical protein